MAKVPTSFEEFSRRDDLTRSAAHGGWSPEQAKAFFPVLSIGQHIPANLTPNPGMSLEPEFISRPAYTPGRQALQPGRQAQPDMPWPELAQRDDFKPRGPRPY